MMRKIDQIILNMAALKGIKIAADELPLIRQHVETAYLDSILSDEEPFSTHKSGGATPAPTVVDPKVAVPDSIEYGTNLPASLRPAVQPSFAASNLDQPPAEPEFSIGPFKGTDPQDAVRNVTNKLVDSLPVVGSAKRFLDKHNLSADVGPDKFMLEYRGKF